MIDDERLRELLARGYEETKGVSFATYVRDRKLDRDGEEVPMIRAMQLAVTEAIKLAKDDERNRCAQIAEKIENSTYATSNDFSVKEATDYAHAILASVYKAECAYGEAARVQVRAIVSPLPPAYSSIAVAIRSTGREAT